MVARNSPKMRIGAGLKKYPAKLLLFGEYTVLLGGQALAMPEWHFHGSWQLGAGPSPAFGETLFRLARHLIACQARAQLPGHWRLHRLLADLKAGAAFHSSIPAGYGLGSSGALVAALCDNYCSTRPHKLPELRRLLAQVEAFFHGSSSGIDPLVSLLQQPLLIEGSYLRPCAHPPLSPYGRTALFLFDTQIDRKTAPLVALFQKRLSEPSFARAIERLQRANEAAIYAFLHGDEAQLIEAWQSISALQFDWLSDMIPRQYREHWVHGRESRSWHFKLCGAGGGGYLLGLTENWLATQRALGAEKVLLVGFFRR